MATAANRGKYAEGQVKTRLKKLESVNVTHHRFPDARAGSFVTAPADFMVLKEGVLTLIEVKETEHDRRLPYSSFGKDQIARMRLWQAAGAKAHVLVCHKRLKLWRFAEVNWFFDNYVLTKDGKAVGSWVLDDIPIILHLDFYFENFL